MNKYVIAYDFGTGGLKASLFDEQGKSVAAAFNEWKHFIRRMNFASNALQIGCTCSKFRPKHKSKRKMYPDLTMLMRLSTHTHTHTHTHNKKVYIVC